MNKSPQVKCFVRQCNQLPDSATLVQAAELMTESELYVIAAMGKFGELKGLIDQRDIIQFYVSHSQNSKLSLSYIIEQRLLNISQKNHLQQTVSQNVPITLAATILAENKTCYLGVTDDEGILIGIITAGDVLTSLNQLFCSTIEKQIAGQNISHKHRTDSNAGKKVLHRQPGKYEHLLRTVIDEIPNIIMMKDWNGRFLMANRALANLYNVTPVEMIGKDDGVFNSNKKQVDFYLDNVRSVMRSGKTQIVLEKSTNAETGEIHYFQSIKKPLQDSNGQPCILIIANDVTDIQKSQKRVEKSERSLKYAMEATGEGLWDWDISSGQVQHNSQWCKILGLDENKINHPIEYFATLIYADDQVKVNQALQDALQGKAQYSSQHRMIRQDGQIIWVLDRGRVVERDSEGKPLRMVGCISDISERKKSEELQLTASVFNHSHDGMMIYDANRVILDVNPAFTDITGYSREEAIGKTADLMKSDGHEDRFFESVWNKVSKNGFWRGEIQNYNRQNELYFAETTISAVKSPSGQLTHYISAFSDISLLKEQQKKLEMLAHYDALTQLPNRVLLADRIIKAQTLADRNKTLLAVCYLDLDGFKPINDKYGHNIGDELLIEVAGRLEATIRFEDTAARLGGDEFVLLLNNIETQEECCQAAERILTVFSCPVPINSNEVRVGASMGVVLYPSVNADADTLLRHADQAMYQAKLSGRNRYHLYDSRNDEHLQAQHEIIKELQLAFLDGEFQLYYQPKVNIREGKIVGFEALIRWQHPERGLVAPGEFLPVLEGHPLSIEVDLWVLEEVMRQLSEWKNMGIEQQVSINLTGDTLLSNTFIHHVKELMSEYSDLSASSIEFEVLETAALEDMHQTSQIFRQCQALGFSIALDDFGTGYSSLTYFRRLPTNTLKIDQSFIRNMLDDPEDMAIVKSVIGLTRAFEREVIAEGVESVEIATALLKIGCNIVQGYGIAYPLPAEQIPRWLENFKPPL